MESDKITAPTEFAVYFNPKIAFTIVYEDAVGKLLLVFSILAPKALAISRHPVENSRTVTIGDEFARARIEQALERTRAYLLDIGYEVTEP